MKSRVVLGSLLLVVGLGSAVAAAGPGTSPDPVTRVEAYFGSGPSTKLTPNSESSAIPLPKTVAVPDAAESYDAVVTVTAQYVTRGEGPWRIGVRVNRSDERGAVAPRPRSFPLQATQIGSPATTTVRFLVRGLVGGASYVVGPEVAADAPRRGVTSVATSKVVMTVELTPAG